MDLMLLGFLAAALCYTLLAALLYRRSAVGADGANWTGRALVVPAAVSALWAWGGAASAGMRWDPTNLPVVLVDIARYAAWFVLLLRLTRGGEARAALRAGLGKAGIALVAAAVVLNVAAATTFGGDRLGMLVLFVDLALPVYGLMLVEQLFRNVPEDFRWHAKPLCIGLVCLFVFDVYLYSQFILFGRVDGDTLAVRAPLHVVACALFWVASRRDGSWTRGLHVSHEAAFHTATLVLVGGYLLLISAVGYYVRYFGGEAGRALQIGVLCVALVVLIGLLASAQMRARLRVLIGKNFFNYRYDYRTEWLRFTATLTSAESPRDVGALIVRGLADLLHSHGGALWSAAVDQADLVQTARWNCAESADAVPRSSSFARFLLEREWIIDLDEYRATPKRYDDLTIPAELLYSSQHWLVVPLVVGEHLIGFVTLSRSAGSLGLDWEVRDLLKTAAKQAAGYLSQMHATEALVEARKFDSFNRMSAFVVHDLKNIVAQLSLMLQNAKRLHANPEFQQDMMLTVEHSLEKMRQLMLQLRDGAVPMGATIGVALAPIAEQMRTMARERGRRLDVDVVDQLTARGHEDRIARVVGHVVQNAFDATPAEGRVSLRVERNGGRAQVVVADTGCGMTPEFIRTRLFKPFSTTKRAGMGIGAYESFQYVRELGGAIDVDSRVGEGTTVSITLPLFETERRVAQELENTR